MKKGVEIIAICIVAMMVLAGCSFKKTVKEVQSLVEDDGIDGDRTEETTNGGFIVKDGSSVERVENYLTTAALGDSIFSLGVDNGKLRFSNESKKEDFVVERPENYYWEAIMAGEKYFYIICQNEIIPNKVHLRLYDEEGNFVSEHKLPVSSLYVSEGMIYGYDDGGDVEMKRTMNISQNYIEATHYMDEKTFLSTFPEEIEAWTKMEGGEEIKVGTRTFYHYEKDYTHVIDYYCDEKKYSVQEQIDFVLYCGGEFSSGESDEKVRPWINQIYKLLDTKEKDFLIYTIQKGNGIYGICNVYGESDGMFNQYTKDVKYSITFQYDEKKDTLYRTGKYEGVDLFYADDENVLYHKLDGAYYKNLVTGEDKKVYDYDGAISVNVIDGYVRFEESVVHYDDDTPNVFKTLKLW